MTSKSRFVEMFGSRSEYSSKWRIDQFTNCCNILYGYPFDSRLFNSDGEGIPLIRIRDINSGVSGTYTTEVADSKYIVQNGDILVSMDGDFSVKEWASGEAYLNQRTCKVKGKKNLIEDSFLIHYLVPELEKIHKSTSATTVKHLSAKEINRLKIPIPPIDLQKHFSTFVKQVNESKVKFHQLIESYDTLIKSRFVEIFGDPVSNSKQWPTKTMKEVAPSKQIAVNVQEEGNWLLNLDAIQSNTGEVLFKNRVPSTELGGSVMTFTTEHVLYSKLRPYLNKVVIPDESGHGTTELIPLLPDSKVLTRTYLAHMLRSGAFVAKFSNAVAGTKMPRVSMDTFWKFPVPLPPLNLQNEFADFVKQVDKSKFAERSTSYPGYASA